MYGPINHRYRLKPNKILKIAYIYILFFFRAGFIVNVVVARFDRELLSSRSVRSQSVRNPFSTLLDESNIEYFSSFTIFQTRFVCTSQMYIYTTDRMAYIEPLCCTIMALAVFVIRTMSAHVLIHSFIVFSSSRPGSSSVIVMFIIDCENNNIIDAIFVSTPRCNNFLHAATRILLASGPIWQRRDNSAIKRPWT